MPWIAQSQVPSVIGYGVTRKIWAAAPTTGTAVFGELPLPTDVTGIDTAPSICMWTGDGKSRMYIVGGHTDNLVLTESLQVYRQGIRPPDNAFAAGAGSGTVIGVAATAASGVGRTGSCVCYVSWWDDTHQRRSPLSGPSPAVVLAGQGIAYTNLPLVTADGDPSVTHIELWDSMDGNTPRLAARRDIGAATATEDVPELSLGEAYAQDFEKFPRCKYNIAWHDRQVMAGDDHYPDRVYFSVLNEFEQYANFYLRTRKGERVTALYSVRDNLFVCSEKSTYVVTGYTEDDVTMDIFEPAVGCICHHGVALVHGLAIVPTHMGFYLNTGDSIHYISEGFGATWREEYAANRLAYEAGWAVNDRESTVYKFCVLDSTPRCLLNETGTTHYWVLDYSKMISDASGNFGSPDLIFDSRYRHDTCAGTVMFPDGRRSDLLVGGEEGIVRRENYLDNTTDDTDTSGLKTLRILTKHYFFLPQGPTRDDGCYWPSLWVYLQHESVTADLNLYLGDEYSIYQRTPQYVEASIPATASSVVIGTPAITYHFVPKTIHYCQPNKSGAGISVEVIVTSAPARKDGTTTIGEKPKINNRVEFRGIGGNFIPGMNDRGVAWSESSS